MALRLVFSREADQDVNDIVDYISVDNPGAAEAVLRRLEKSATLLCSRPNMGMLALATGRSDMRKLSVPPYIVFYRITDTHLQVARVLHSSRDLEDKALFID